MAGADKKLFKKLESKYNGSQTSDSESNDLLSPISMSSSTSKNHSPTQSRSRSVSPRKYRDHDDDSLSQKRMRTVSGPISMRAAPYPTVRPSASSTPRDISNQNRTSTASNSFQPHSPLSPLSDLHIPSHRRTFFYLVSTLNNSFPDYDFSSLTPSSFVALPLSSIVSELNRTLFNLGNETLKNVVGSLLWPGIDEALKGGLNDEELECWKYVSGVTEGGGDGGEDPLMEEGTLWSSITFIYHKKQKRIILLTFRTVSPFSSSYSYPPSYPASASQSRGSSPFPSPPSSSLEQLKEDILIHNSERDNTEMFGMELDLEEGGNTRQKWRMENDEDDEVDSVRGVDEQGRSEREVEIEETGVSIGVGV